MEEKKAAEDNYQSGLSNQQKGAYDKAIEDFSRVIEELPRHTLAYVGRGLTYYKRGKEGDSARAIADFGKAMGIYPASFMDIIGAGDPLSQEMKDKLLEMYNTRKGKEIKL